MQLYPAVDIKDGKAVRLKQGKFDEVTVYGDDPIEAAKAWVDAGATYLHIVDLDGAKYGSGYNNELISRIAREFGVPVQTGGGIRNMDDVRIKLEAGVARVILGTAAIKDGVFVREAVQTYGDKIAVGIDASNGFAATNAWTEVSEVTALELCREMESIGVRTVIYTDISRDGMMNGLNIEATKALIDTVDMDIIASGGVSCYEDLAAAKEIGASGVIIGKSLYNGAIDLKKALDLYEKN